MLLNELMNYFNKQLQMQAGTKFLPKTDFFQVNNTYCARFGNLVLGSKFHTIYTAGSEKLFGFEKFIGFESELIVRSAMGNLLNIDTIFNSLDSHEQIIHLDRLIRKLHLLNYLQRNNLRKIDNKKYLLSLPIQSRHILSVTDDHGCWFEGILRDCELAPEQVLLHTKLVDGGTLKHFYQALDNYRDRGYQVGLSIMQDSDLALLEKLEFEPDIIFCYWSDFKASAKLDAVNLLAYYNSQCVLVTPMSRVPDSIDELFGGVLLLNDGEFEDLVTLKQVNYF